MEMSSINVEIFQAHIQTTITEGPFFKVEALTECIYGLPG